MQYFIYVIKSKKDGRLYVGMTSDLEERLFYHNAGYQFSTKGYRPWEIVYSERAASRLLARQREKYFKSGCGKEFLKSFI
ncbi:MAG: GIY-YIG nuclease family protein [Patescibacteria group bacterium]|jgi:putative endonuclease